MKGSNGKKQVRVPENVFMRPSDLERMGVCSARRAQELCAAGKIKAVMFASRWLIYRDDLMRSLGLDNPASQSGDDCSQAE